MDRPLNKEILRLSIPSIVANITVPLVGMVDTAVAGHIPCQGESAAVYIGGISVGAMIFNLLYWNFSFLRTTTGGLTAQAFGRRDNDDCARNCIRSLGLAIIIGILTLSLQLPLSLLATAIVDASPRVEELALRYFFIRIWAAPATLSLKAYRGWFVGMQDSMASMWTDLIVNGVNIAGSIILSFGIGGWEGLGFDGVALGTVVAQYSGFTYATLKVFFKYRKKVFSGLHLSDVPPLFKFSSMRPILRLNTDFFIRSLGFTAIYMGFTIIAASFGDVLLACSSIMMELLMVFSYFTDGFAYAGEALTGRFIGERNQEKLVRTVKYVFAWSFGVSLVWTLIYWKAGLPMMKLMTNDPEVLKECALFLPWLIAMPLFGCTAFTWDGIYLGATASRPIRNSMLGAVGCFFAVWYLGKFVILPLAGCGDLMFRAESLHMLLGAYFAHLVFRSIYLTIKTHFLNLESVSSIPR